jgi:hypothetical protein
VTIRAPATKSWAQFPPSCKERNTAALRFIFRAKVMRQETADGIKDPRNPVVAPVNQIAA